MNETHLERRRGIRARAAYAVTVVSAAAALFAVSCTTEGKPVFIGDYLPEAPSFTSLPEGGADAEAGLLSYCPSSQCPAGWTTCADSRFPCDTNILADVANCGGCGMACPPGTGFEVFTCNEGACKLECHASTGSKDCDGIIDNGCESSVLDPTNCGACGVVCAVGQRCLWQDQSLAEVGCGCPPGKIACGICTDGSADDSNCGACNNACDPTGGANAPQYANMYYGCVAGQCGKLKCQGLSADCDGELHNGCETSILTDDNCGACGTKCGAGQKCAVDLDGNVTCLCPPGLEFCQVDEEHGLPKGACVDVSTDVDHCGTCGTRCTINGPREAQMPACDFGKCGVQCLDGWADCNGSQVDGCEIDTKRDPRNCGGCGVACDLTMGQACVAGKCVVEPCDKVDAGEVTR